MDIMKRLQGLETADLIGQLLCYDIYDKDDPAEVEKILKKIRPGGIFLTRTTREKVKLYTDMANKYTKLPVIVAADIECGPGAVVKGEGLLPHPMAWGAADDPVLLNRAARAVGHICRDIGVHWTFSPIVDMNYNFRCSESNIRSISDDPDQVIRQARAYMDGLQEDGRMVCCCKHFPGQGVDERNSHFLTAVNTLSREEWMATYGRVYRTFIEAGVPSIMIGHIALPAYQQDEDDGNGPLPAVLSRALMTDLLKGELGFQGCVVSDAMSMIGVAARVDDLRTVGLQFIQAGGDMILFPEPSDHEVLTEAYLDGRLSKERLMDAVCRVVAMKEQARLFADGPQPTVEPVPRAEFEHLAQAVADKSIKILRNRAGVLPLQLEPGARLLMVNVLEPPHHAAPSGHEFDAMKEELERCGYAVDVLTNPKHHELSAIMDGYAAVLANCKMGPMDYHGGTMRYGWTNVMTFWRGYILHHPRFIFTSFGDPYKLYDMPYLKTYINAFSFSDASQRAAARVVLGLLEAQGKNPVQFDGFFDREV